MYEVSFFHPDIFLLFLGSQKFNSQKLCCVVTPEKTIKIVNNYEILKRFQIYLYNLCTCINNGSAIQQNISVQLPPWEASSPSSGWANEDSLSAPNVNR